MQTFTAELKEVARGAGADLVGVARIARFEDVTAEHHPASIFPEVRSVIVLAKRITRGCLRGVEEGTQFSLYATYAMNWLPDRFMALTTVTVASFLEDQRWEAVPLPELPPQVPAMGVAVKPGLPRPNVMLDFADAAVRAGLGQIGFTGELMTPQFGHLQRVQIVLTDAELDGDPMCAQPVCDRCGECVRACPLGAISSTPARTLTICGTTAALAKIDSALCLRCKNGAWPNRSHPSGAPDRLAAACMRACVCHLEKTNRLEKRFRQPFRQRAAWMVGDNGVPALVPEVRS